MGSNDKIVYSDVCTISSDLPQAAGKSYNSPVFNCGELYRYLRFKVSAERVYWHMGEFELYYTTSTATLLKQFEGTSLTDAYAAARYDVLMSAVNVYKYGTTSAQVLAAKETLQKAYDELLAMKNSATGIAGIADAGCAEGAPIYNLAGCSLVHIENPGVYVVNGKKILVK
jgi:hypothetical protein